MRVDGYVCDGCGVFDPGRSGNQLDPGPFLPKGWWGAPATRYGPTLCPECTVAIKNGALTKDRKPPVTS